VRRSITTRLAGFTGGPVLAAFAPLLILPVITRATGSAGWASFAAGQSVGMIGLIVLTFGWGIVGPVRIAQNPEPAARARILAESLVTRGLAAIAVLPIAAAVAAYVAAPDFRADAVAIAVATALGGFTPAWFCIGAGQPGALTGYDVAPRVVAAAISAGVIAWTGQVSWYAGLLTVFSIGAFALHARRTMRGHDARMNRSQVLVAWRQQIPTAAIDTVSNSYGATPVPIASRGLAAVDAGSFASADRLYRFGLLAVVAFGNAFQGWVLERDAENRRARHRLAILTHLGLGLVGGLGSAALGPWATAIAFGADVAATRTACLLFGIAFVCISTTTPFIRNVMIPHGRYRQVFTVACASAVTGVTIMVTGAMLGDLTVIAAGVLASEVVSMVAIVVPARRLLHTPAPASAPAPPPEATP